MFIKLLKRVEFLFQTLRVNDSFKLHLGVEFELDSLIPPVQLAENLQINAYRPEL